MIQNLKIQSKQILIFQKSKANDYCFLRKSKTNWILSQYLSHKRQSPIILIMIWGHPWGRWFAGTLVKISICRRQNRFCSPPHCQGVAVRRIRSTSLRRARDGERTGFVRTVRVGALAKTTTTSPITNLN